MGLGQGAGLLSMLVRLQSTVPRELSGGEMDGIAHHDAKEPLSCSLEQTGRKPPTLKDSI